MGSPHLDWSKDYIVNIRKEKRLEEGLVQNKDYVSVSCNCCYYYQVRYKTDIFLGGEKYYLLFF